MPNLLETQRHHAQYYLDILHATNEYYETGGDNIPQALAQFDQDREQIEQGQAWSATHSKQDNEAKALCSAWPNCLTCISLI